MLKTEKSGKKEFLGWDVPSKNSNPDSPKTHIQLTLFKNIY